MDLENTHVEKKFSNKDQSNSYGAKLEIIKKYKHKLDNKYNVYSFVKVFYFKKKI